MAKANALSIHFLSKEDTQGEKKNHQVGKKKWTLLNNPEKVTLQDRPGPHGEVAII